jgi:cytochrome P450
MFATDDPKLHRQRREPVGSYFSKRNIRKLEGLMQEKVHLLMQRTHEEHVKDAVLNLSDMTSALAIDTISAYCFGHGMRRLEEPEYASLWRRILTAGAASNAFARHYPTINS